eukprot:1158535-Pelagomonas_calceolata.AAC.3
MQGMMLQCRLAYHCHVCVLWCVCACVRACALHQALQATLAGADLHSSSEWFFKPCSPALPSHSAVGLRFSAVPRPASRPGRRWFTTALSDASGR